MTAPRPRALAWRGVIDAAGFLLDTSLAGETEARRRILALLHLGCSELGWLA